MPRLKFLLFALAAIALAVVHIPLVSKPLSARALEQAQTLTQGAPAAVLARLEERRLNLLHAVIAASGSTPVVAGSRGGKTELVLPPKTVELRAVLAKVVSPDVKDALIVGFLNDEKSIFVRGDGEAVTDGAGLDMAALMAAPPEGVLMDAFNVPHHFYVVPVSRLLETGEAKPVGHFFLGAPALTAKDVDDARKSLGVMSLAVLDKNVAKWTSGDAGALRLEQRPGTRSVLERGGLSLFGLHLPLFAGDGEAPLTVGARQPVPSSRFEVAATVSLRPFIMALAEYQRLALLGIAILVLLGAVGTALAGPGEEEAPGMAVDPRVPMSPNFAASSLPRTDEELDNERTIASDISAFTRQHAPEASPDDFQFPSSASRGSAPQGMDEAGAEADAEQPFPPKPTFHTDDQPTAAYPVHEPLPEGASNGHGLTDENDFNPEQTRIAEVPDELLRASAQAAEEASEPEPAPLPLVAAKPPAASPVNMEEQHFQDVYKDFMATRDRCGEGADGLTYDKFAAKLRKNREQLVQKYNCRTVRFQVYVKEGKAALKATPLKE